MQEVKERYIREYDDLRQKLRSRKQQDAAACEQLESQLREVESAVSQARDERRSVEAQRQAARGRAAARVAAKRQQLRELRAAVREAWRRSGADSKEVAEFLRRLQSVLPYTAQTHAMYESKLGELRSATPLLQQVARREVLHYRIAHLRRRVTQLLRSRSASGADFGTGVGVGPATEAEVLRIRSEVDAARGELEGVESRLKREVAEWEGEHQKPFLHRGVRLLDELEGIGSAAFAGASEGKVEPAAAAVASAGLSSH